MSLIAVETYILPAFFSRCPVSESGENARKMISTVETLGQFDSCFVFDNRF